PTARPCAGLRCLETPVFRRARFRLHFQSLSPIQPVANRPPPPLVSGRLLSRQPLLLSRAGWVSSHFQATAILWRYPRAPPAAELPPTRRCALVSQPPRD